MNKCPIFKRCGGCQYLDRSYEETIEMKRNLVKSELDKQAIKVPLDQVVLAASPYAYRNKMQITFKSQSGKTTCGFYEENSHKVVDLDVCLMHSEMQNEIAKALKQLVIDLRLKPYDEDRQTGLIRHAIIRESKKNKQCMVTIVTATEIFPARSEFVKRLKEQFKSISTIIQNINPRKTSIILGEKERILFGPGYIEDELCGLRFKILSKSFFQINPEQTEKLYMIAKQYAQLQPNDVLLDAYSGVGTIGMLLSSNAKQVVCVESNKDAHRAAIENAKNNHITNMRFINEDATLFMKQLASEGSTFDVLVLDPPRSGATIEFIQNAIACQPKRIVYVSCNPETLARDLKLFQSHYKIETYSIVDMFCWTKHVETVVSLSRK